MDTALIVGCLWLASASFLWMAWAGATRRLSRNSWAGIRTRRTTRSEEAWFSAHEAAAGPFRWTGSALAVAGLVLLVVGFDSAVGWSVAVVGALVALGGTTMATMAALRAT